MTDFGNLWPCDLDELASRGIPMKKSRDAIKTIRRALEEYSCGWRNAEALLVIMRAAGDIKAEAGDSGDVREKLASLTDWVDKLYSPRKHASWGTDLVKDFIRGDCRRLEMIIRRLEESQCNGMARL